MQTVNTVIVVVAVLSLPVVLFFWRYALVRVDPLPSYPLHAENVPPSYVLKGDARWYPHP